MTEKDRRHPHFSFRLCCLSSCVLIAMTFRSNSRDCCIHAIFSRSKEENSKSTNKKCQRKFKSFRCKKSVLQMNQQNGDHHVDSNPKCAETCQETCEQR